jgi:hypothetical protein
MIPFQIINNDFNKNKISQYDALWRRSNQSQINNLFLTYNNKKNLLEVESQSSTQHKKDHQIFSMR